MIHPVLRGLNSLRYSVALVTFLSSIVFVMQSKTFVEEKTTAKLKDKQTSIATIREQSWNF